MNRVLSTLLLFIIVSSTIKAQQVNLYTIPNQSANFVRMPAREASTEIDAVFSNPAGLTELEKGLHISVNNQFLRQRSVLTSDYPYLENGETEYVGDVGSLIFPSIYAAWKRDRFAYSFGFSLIGGGGGAEYTDLPINEIGISDIPVVLNLMFLDALDQKILNSTGTDPGYSNIPGYEYEFYNRGVGYSPGLQFNGSYRFNDYISGALGVRWVNQFVDSKGYIRGIKVDVPQFGQLFTPGNYLRFVGDEVGGIDKVILNIIAPLIDSLAADREIDIQQRGHGFTPIFSLNVRPTEKLNVAVKYEHKTKVDLTTTVFDGKDGGGEFVNDTITSSDLPGFFTFGIQYEVTPKITAAFGTRYLLSKGPDWGGREKLVNKNYYELEFAGEYKIGEKAVISGGYTFVKPNVQPTYQNDVDFALTGHTGAIGGAYDISDELRINAGFLYTWYQKKTYQVESAFAQGAVNDDIITSNQSYDKTALIFAIGIEMVIGSAKDE